MTDSVAHQDSAEPSTDTDTDNTLDSDASILSSDARVSYPPDLHVSRPMGDEEGMLLVSVHVNVPISLITYTAIHDLNHGALIRHWEAHDLAHAMLSGSTPEAGSRGPAPGALLSRRGPPHDAFSLLFGTLCSTHHPSCTLLTLP